MPDSSFLNFLEETASAPHADARLNEYTTRTLGATPSNFCVSRSPHIAASSDLRNGSFISVMRRKTISFPRFETGKNKKGAADLAAPFFSNCYLNFKTYADLIPN